MRSSRISARWGKLAAVLIALALVLPSVVLGTGSALAQEENVLRVHHPTYPDVFDPQKSSFTNEIDILGAAYEGLTRLDTDQQTVPGAAESWEYNDDATELTFALREGLTYADGSPLTAENFRYAVERTCDPNTAGEYQSILFEIVGCQEFAELGAVGEGTPEASPVSDEARQAAIANLGAEVIDDRTLKLTLTNPAPYFHTIAYTWVFFPVKREIAEADPDTWWQSAENHVSNGPFVITSIDEDQRITFEANENYWQGRPLLDGMEYIYIDDAAIALEAYRAGDLDIVQLEPPQIPEVEADPELSEQYLSYPTASTYNLSFNLTQEPFNDPKVREAFSLGFDRETYCAEIRSGDCSPTTTWIPEGIPGAIESDKFAYDLEAAQLALAESSYGGAEALPEISVSVNSDFSGYQERAEFVAEMYREGLGFEIGIEPVDGTTLTALRKDSATYPQMLLVGGWIQDYPDPQNWLSVFWTCDSTFAERVGYCNEEFDALVRQGDTTVDPEERIGYYEEAGQLLIDDVPGPFLYNQNGAFVVDPRVSGITPTASEVEWPGSLSSLMTIEIAPE